ncbi:hypothetical protein RM844_07905 [Streptomyces sp. DSM 44915]|uniref:Uncharacterized protein n=1 Tax=Streptomyces chisholmiae TaxID=3075540 RepID=A0ABU2JML3_9ACTN|nr:hypothetical protein [Streptomyces sp. DSM 44915]MDT0266217.1 hypothetical protein [Streptomyces sp. DSM 44915]
MVDAKVKIPRGADDGDDPAAPPAPSGAGRRRIELTWPQVVASAAATVAGALLASGLGVYGTVLGAGLISLIATAGGPVFQHILDRGGRAADPAPAAQAPAERRRAPRRRAGRPGRLRRRLAVALGVFVLAMTAITGIELASGSSFAGWWQQDRAGETSVGDLFGRGGTGGTPADDTESEPADTDTDTDTDSDPESDSDTGPDASEPGAEEPSTTPEEGAGEEGPTGDGSTTPGESPPPTQDAPPAETGEPPAAPAEPTAPAPSSDEPTTPGRNAQPEDATEDAPTG